MFIQIPNEVDESENRSSIIEDEISEIAQIRKAVPDVGVAIVDRGGGGGLVVAGGGERSENAFAAAGEEVRVADFSEELVVVDVDWGLGDRNAPQEEEEEEGESAIAGLLVSSSKYELHVWVLERENLWERERERVEMREKERQLMVGVSL